MSSGLEVLATGLNASIWSNPEYMCKDLETWACHVLRSARVGEMGAGEVNSRHQIVSKKIRNFEVFLVIDCCDHIYVGVGYVGGHKSQ